MYSGKHKTKSYIKILALLVEIMEEMKYRININTFNTLFKISPSIN